VFRKNQCFFMHGSILGKWEENIKFTHYLFGSVDFNCLQYILKTYFLFMH